MPFSKSIAAPGSRIRNWSIRAALLMACVATVATSEISTTTITVLDPPPAPIILTAQQGQTTRHVTVRIAPQKDEFSGSFNVIADISARWVAADAYVGPPPTLRVKWIAENPRGNRGQTQFSFEEYPTTPSQGTVTDSHIIECEGKRECLWKADLEFTLEGEAQGHIDISEWNLEVHISPSGDRELPEKDITISVEER